MSADPPPTPPPPVSPAGRFRWDGERFKWEPGQTLPQVSSDGKSYRDGTRWVSPLGSLRSPGLGRRGTALVIGLAVLSFGGCGYFFSLYSRQQDLNCVGQTNVVAAKSQGDVLSFAGSDKPDGLYYTAPFAMSTDWIISWYSDPGELTITLYDASARAPSHNEWNPLVDNSTGYVNTPVSYYTEQNSPYIGSRLESRRGNFCLSVLAGNQSGAIPWKITVAPG